MQDTPTLLEREYTKAQAEEMIGLLTRLRRDPVFAVFIKEVAIRAARTERELLEVDPDKPGAIGRRQGLAAAYRDIEGLLPFMIEQFIALKYDIDEQESVSPLSAFGNDEKSL